MTKQSMEYLDLGLLILVLGLVISLGVSSLYRTNRQVQSSSQNYMEDKNTGRSKGYLISKYGEYDGTLSQMQVVLLSQIQDSNMPYPRKVVINGINIEIPIWYKEYRFECGQKVWNLIKNQENSTRYSMDYQYILNDSGGILDEFYAVNQVKNE